MTRYFSCFVSPLGPGYVVVNAQGEVVSCGFGSPGLSGSSVESGDRCRHVLVELSEYFDGRRKQFSVPLAPTGTPFQEKVWNLLRAIPYGTTISYRELATRLGNPRAVRAVGGANGANPIAVIVPCHRVIGSDGSLTGYGGGLHIKERLLQLERSGA